MHSSHRLLGTLFFFLWLFRYVPLGFEYPLNCHPKYLVVYLVSHYLIHNLISSSVIVVVHRMVTWSLSACVQTVSLICNLLKFIFLYVFISLLLLMQSCRPHLFHCGQQACLCRINLWNLIWKSFCYYLLLI